MRHVTLRQLQVFAAVARDLSFSKAAGELHLTQPAVSMQVRQLEAAAGMPLFERVGRRTALTDAGRELLASATGVDDLLRRAEESLNALRGMKAGTLKLGAVSTAKYFAPALLAGFLETYPGVTVRFVVGNREEVIAQLADNAIDLAVMGAPPAGLETVAEPFARHPIVVVARPDHPLARKRRIPLERLAAEPFLMREEGSGTRAALERLFREHRLKLNTTMEMASNETIKQAVIAGLGVSFLSAHTLGLELEAGKLVILDVAGLPVVRDWYAIHRRDKKLAPIPAAFRRFLVGHGAAMLEKATGIRLRPRAKTGLASNYAARQGALHNSPGSRKRS